jgi:hypothetical protein
MGLGFALVVTIAAGIPSRGDIASSSWTPSDVAESFSIIVTPHGRRGEPSVRDWLQVEDRPRKLDRIDP